MSHKFNKNRSVSVGYCKCPMFYTGIINPKNKNKELVIMDQFGKNFSACWRNNELCKTGIEFLLPIVDGGFKFKGKIILLKNCNKVY